MKINLKSLLTALAVLIFAACSDSDENAGVKYLDVTPNNIAGEWMLSSWGENTLAEGSYVYIELLRSDRTFKIYQNIDSVTPRMLTGVYNIENDSEWGAVIRGTYDYGQGDWQHRYIISELSSERMVWTAKDDAEDVSVYVRCDIPEQITEQF